MHKFEQYLYKVINLMPRLFTISIKYLSIYLITLSHMLIWGFGVISGNTVSLDTEVGSQNGIMKKNV